MKKTIIVLFLFGSFALAGEPVTWTSTAGNLNLTCGKDSENNNVKSWDVSGASLSMAGGSTFSTIVTISTLGITTSDTYSLAAYNTGSLKGIAGFYIKDGFACLDAYNFNPSTVDISSLLSGDNKANTLTFVCSLSSNNMTLDIYKNSDFTTKAATSLTLTGTKYGGHTVQSIYYGGNKEDTEFSEYTTSKAKLPNVGADFTLMGAAYTAGTVVNTQQLTSYYAAAIPEPTTATLSLLALAGLVARRRRK